MGVRAGCRRRAAEGASAAGHDAMTRRAILVGSLAAILLMAAAAARAAPFWGGTLTLKVGPLPPIPVSASQGAIGPAQLVRDLDGTHGGRIRLEKGAFLPTTFDLPDSLFTGIPRISDLRIGAGAGAGGLGAPKTTATLAQGFADTANAAGPPLAGSFGGTAALSGTATLCVLGCGNLQVPVPLSRAGAGGTTTPTLAGRNLFLRGAPWTTGTAVVTIPTTTPGGRVVPGANVHVTTGGLEGAATTLPLRAAAHTAGSSTAKGATTVLRTMTGATTALFHSAASASTTAKTTRTLSLAGFDTRTAGGIGTVQLVSPARVDTGDEVAGSLGVFSVQTLHFIPEPGTLLLLGAGVAGLAALGRSRMES